jgi:ABC-type phosphate/phosphonate transport system substrate-binding protein
MEARSAMREIVVGAVAYDPKAVTIWEMIRDLFRDRPHTLDYRLFSNYESQVDALFLGHVNVAWNTNVAWVRTKHRSKGKARALAMRDSDVGFTTKLVVRKGSGIKGPRDLKGKRVALGSRDSAQAAILPTHFLKEEGLVEKKDYESLRFDIDVGKHGDTGGSELLVLKSLVEGEADAGTIGDSTWGMLLAQGAVDKGKVEAVWTSPGYCHCNFTALDVLPQEIAKSFVDGLLAMDYADPRVRAMMDLEGLKRWVPGRTEGYEVLEQAMQEQGLLR